VWEKARPSLWAKADSALAWPSRGISRYTPRHGSWLNLAEVELAALAKQCLGRRIETAEDLRREVGAWNEQRNAAEVVARWQFTTAKARVKLHRLYPTVQ
jgi:hypothetical protein